MRKLILVHYMINTKIKLIKVKRKSYQQILWLNVTMTHTNNMV